MKELQNIFAGIKEKIDERLSDFELTRQFGSEEEIFTELVFCLMTPQTKARQAEKAVKLLKDKDLLFQGEPEKLAEVLNIVRFRNHKAGYIVKARENLPGKGKPGLKAALQKIPGVSAKREWLFQSIKGMGIKEASHFLRNIGYGKEVAILDRHVLRTLVRLNILEKEPASLSEKKYLEIEEKMKELSKKSGIPMEYLDFVIWYKETNDIFK